MKIAVISNEKFALKVKGFKIRVFQWSEVGETEINLRDFDGVIVILTGLTNDAKGVDWPAFEDLLNHEVAQDVLLQEGSFIYVIGNPFTNGHQNSIASLLGMNLKYIEGKGDSIIKGNHFDNSPYKNYLEGIKTYEYSFLAKGASQTVRNNAEVYGRKAGLRTTSYLENRSGYVVAADMGIYTYELNYNNYPTDQRPLHAGRITLLPTADIASRDLVKMLLEINTDVDLNTAPDWINDITVNGQAEVDEKLSANEKAASDLSLEKENLEKKRSKLRQPLEILYKSGKPLEISIKAVLAKMGLKIIEPESPEKVEFYISFNGNKFVVEVKSTSGETIDQKGLRQAIDWQNDAFDETGEDYKPLVIVSTQFDKPLDERTESILPSNLREYAEKRSIAVLKVMDLFNISEDIAQGGIRLSDFVQELADCSGMFKKKSAVPTNEKTLDKT